jgi:hypothetical protein
MKIQNSEIKNLIREIVEMFNKGWKSFEQTGKMIARFEAAVGVEESTKLLAAAEYRLTPEVQHILKGVAGGRHNAALIGDPHPAAKAALTYSRKVQDLLLGKPFPVVTHLKDGGAPNVEEKTLHELKRKQVHFIVDADSGKLLPVSEQVERIKMYGNLKKFRSSQAKDWVRESDRIFFINPKRGYTYHQLLEIAEKVKPSNQ